VRAAARRAELATPILATPDGGPLSPGTITALRAARFEDNRIRLADTLPRETYDELAEAFSRIGGRWTRGGPKRRDGAPAGYHTFPGTSIELVHALIESGRMPPRNPTAFFPSPPSVVDAIIEAGDFGGATECGFRFLEPHAGQGAVAERIRALHPKCTLDTVEILDLNRLALRRKGFDPIAADFLRFKPGAVYDRILMNPPFSLPGSPRAYQDHIRHGWELLAPGGILVSVAPAGIRFAGSREFRRWVSDRGSIEDLPEGSFDASGTGVSTVLVTLEKWSVGWKRKPFQGFPSWHAWTIALVAENTATHYAAETELHRRMTAGEFGHLTAGGPAPRQLATAVRYFYESVAERLRGPPEHVDVFLSDEDHNALYFHFIDRYRDHVPDESFTLQLPRRVAA